MSIKYSKVEDAVFLDAGDGQTFDASPFDGLVFSGAHYSNLTVINASGNVQLGANAETAKFIGCRFINWKVNRISFGNSSVQQCEFYNLNAKSVASHSADIICTRFHGKIDAGIFSIGEIDSLRMNSKLLWFENDFSECHLGDVDFRGGIALKKSMFSPSVARRLLCDLDRLIPALKDSAHDKSMKAMVDWISRHAAQICQTDFLIPLTIQKKWGSDFDRLMSLVSIVEEAEDAKKKV